MTNMHGWTRMVSLMALCVVALSACRRPPAFSEADGGPAGPITCTGWTKVTTTPFPSTYRGIWGSSTTDVYFLHRNLASPTPMVSGSEIQHYDGKTVTKLATTAGSSLGSPYNGQPVGIWGSGSSNVYLALSGGLLRFDGSTWTKVAGLPPMGITHIWGTGPDNVYVVGGGEVGHFDGKTWSIVLSVKGVKFKAVWCSTSGDVFAVGHSSFNGKIYHFDGATWNLSLSRPWSVFSGVWGTGTSNVFTVGHRGGANFMYRFDGQGWSKEALPWHETTIGRMVVVWGFDSSRVFAGGMYTLLGRDGQQWHAIDVPSGSYDDIQGLWGSGTSLFVAANEWNGTGAIWRATCSR
jgi:hypothetical protein